MSRLRHLSLLLSFALALVGSHGLRAAISPADREVQTLANFPALQKLAENGDGALRLYLSSVSGTYRKAGYGDFARELRQSGPLVVLFGQPERADAPGALKRARGALRDLQQALAKNHFVVLPEAQGSSVPDYYNIAAAFLDAADIALKNLSTRRNVANSLRNNKGTRWLINKGNDQFTLSGPFGIASTITIMGSVSLVKSGVGTLVLSGANTYSGATLVIDGALRSSVQGLELSWSQALASDSLTILNHQTALGSGAPSGATLDYSGIFTIGSDGVYSLGKTLAFPPDVALPTDQTYRLIRTLAAPEAISSNALPTGTRIITVPVVYPTPAGASELSAVTLGNQGAIFNFNGSGTLTLATPTPTPTPTPVPAE